ADAVLELQQVRFRAEELRFAQQLAEVMLTRFQDSAGGGFDVTSDDHETLIHRSRTFADDASPALSRYPQAHVSLVTALEELLDPAETVILRGEARTIEGWRQELAPLYAPRRLVLAIPDQTPELPPALAEKTSRAATVAYVCRGSTCSAPIDSLGALTEQLRAGDGA